MLYYNFSLKLAGLMKKDAENRLLVNVKNMIKNRKKFHYF